MDVVRDDTELLPPDWHARQDRPDGVPSQRSAIHHFERLAADSCTTWVSPVHLIPPASLSATSLRSTSLGRKTRCEISFDQALPPSLLGHPGSRFAPPRERRWRAAVIGFSAAVLTCLSVGLAVAVLV